MMHIRSPIKTTAVLLSVGGLGFGLIGSGVRAAMTASGSVVGNVAVGTLSCAVSSTDPSANVVGNSVTITLAPVASSTGSSLINGNVTVTNTGSIPEQVTWAKSQTLSASYTAVAAPAAVTLATNGAFQSTPGLGVSWTGLTNADLGTSGSVTYTATCGEVPPPPPPPKGPQFVGVSTLATTTSTNCATGIAPYAGTWPTGFVNTGFSWCGGKNGNQPNGISTAGSPVITSITAPGTSIIAVGDQINTGTSFGSAPDYRGTVLSVDSPTQVTMTTNAVNSNFGNLLIYHSDPTFPVTSTAAFPSSGTFIVNGANISYTGKTATTFTGLTLNSGGGAQITSGSTVKPSSLSLPAGATTGDVAVVLAIGTSTNKGSAPSGYTTITSVTTAYNYPNLSYRVLVSGDTSVPVANGTDEEVAVYRGLAATPIGAHGQIGGPTAPATMSCPAATLTKTTGSSWVACIGSASSSTNANTMVFGSMTNRSSGVPDAHMGLADTNAGVSSWAGATWSGNTPASGAYSVFSVELLSA